MENGNIPVASATSPESFDVDLSKLDALQVEPEQTPGSTEGSQPLQVEVEPKYKGLPGAEGIARTIQNKYDKLNMDYLKVMKENQQYGVYKEVLTDLYENEDALYAFLTERKPELVSNRDIKTEVTKRLTDKGYGGYEPQLSRDEAERKDPGGKDWLYYREIDKITNEVLGAGSYAKHKSLKEFREARIAEVRTQEANIEAEIADAKERLKMSDAEVDWNRKFIADLKFADIAKITRFIRKFHNAPTMGNIPGGPIVGMSKERKDFLDGIK